MRDLHVVAVSESGTTIVLADEAGEQFTVPIDDRLRAALRGDRVREGQLQIAMTSQLSPREREVALAIARGLKSAEIATLLHISTRTVNTHLEHIYERLQLRTRTALAGLVARSGLQP